MSLRTITAAIAIGAVALVASCTDAGSPLLIMQNQVPGDGCVVPTAADTYNPRGQIDTNAGAGYLFTPLVQNVATADDDNAHLRTIFVEGADIDISIQGGGAAVNEDLLSFSKRFSGVVEPSGGTTSFAFTVIPPEVLTALAGGLTDPTQLLEVVVDVSIYGNQAGGDVSSPVFSYPIDVCNGCMKRDVGACADLSADFAASAGGACITLQDAPIDCCTTADSQELCPASAPAE